MKSALSQWFSADRDLRRVIAWLAGVFMTALAGPASGIFRVLGDQPIEVSTPLTLVGLYLACIGMTVPTSLLLFATGKGTGRYASAVIFMITAFVCVGAVATLQTEFMSQASSSDLASSSPPLEFADAAALTAIAITATVFVSTFSMQMELAKIEHE